MDTFDANDPYALCAAELERQNRLFAKGDAEADAAEMAHKNSLRKRLAHSTEEAMKQTEAEILARHSASAHAFLVQNVLPELMLGLIEVANVRPEDPVEYLVCFLSFYCVTFSFRSIFSFPGTLPTRSNKSGTTRRCSRDS